MVITVETKVIPIQVTHFSLSYDIMGSLRGHNSQVGKKVTSIFATVIVGTKATLFLIQL